MAASGRMLAALAVCISGSATHGHPRDHDTTAPPPKLLLAPRLQRLGCGATKPAGWLKDELTLQARGISGQLPYFWEFFNQSAWMGGKGRDPQQYLPYYLQGMIPLSYQIDDRNLAALRDEYVRFIVANQSARTDGWLGTPVEAADPHEYWSKYDMVEALEYFAEAEPSRSAQIKASLVRHHAALFRALNTNAPDFNQSRWGVDRYSDGIVGIQWLLDQGEGDKPGGSFLWELLRLLRGKADSLMAARDHSWERWFDSDRNFTSGSTSPFNYTARAANSGAQDDPTGFVHLLRHGVDIGQAMKTGPLWWRVDGEERDWDNAQASVEWAEAYLHRADGMYFADEEVDGDHTPSRGTETCSVVETMFSMRAVYEVTGNITFMDRLETIAFNALPAALWPDATANVYHHANNQIETGPGSPYAYDLYFCCSANVHQGWPKFIFSAVHTQAPETLGGKTSHGADDDDDDAETLTIVISGYAPTISTVGTAIVTISGTYPFSDSAKIHLSSSPGAAASASTRRNLRLRVPCWAEGATITVDSSFDDNSRSLRTLSAPACSFANVSVAIGATLTINFDNKIKLYEWKQSSLDGQSKIAGGGVEVHRGALTYSLRPKSTVILGKPGGIVQPYPQSLPGGDRAAGGWGNISHRQVTIASNTSWNYGIYVDSLTFEDAIAPVPPVPFDVNARPPVQIRAKGRRVPAWTTAGGARGIQPLPRSPLSSAEPLEDLVLVPYGATNIRISVFPQLCNAGDAGCPPPPPPAPAPDPGMCHPTQNPPNMKLDENLPNGDLIPGGAELALFNATECYARCLAWNLENAESAGKPKCDAWVATGAKPSGEHKPWCWLKSHATDGGYERRHQTCFVSAECRVGVPASEFPCAE